MNQAADPVFTLLRIWAEGLATPEVLSKRLLGLAVNQREKRLGLAVLACGDETVMPGPARELALALQVHPDWLNLHQARWQASPILRQQLGIQLAKAASLLHAEPILALLLYDRALLMMPELAAAWYFRGLLRQASGQWPQAAADLSQACRLQPEWVPAWQEGARALLLCGQAEQGLSLIDEGLGHLPQQAALWLTRGNLCQALGRLDQAEAAYRRSLDIDPEQAGVWSNLGLVCHQQLRLPEAQDCYKRALALDPGLAELWNNLASLHLEQGELEPAETCLNRCLQLTPGYYPAWVNRGLLAAALGQRELAHSLFAQARTLNPLRPESWLEEASLYLAQDQESDALKLLGQGLVQAQSRGTATPELEMSCGRLLALQHRPEATEHMRAALAQQPERDFWRFVMETGTAESFVCRPASQRQSYLNHLAGILPAWAETPFAPQVYLQESRYLPLETLWNLIYLDNGAQPGLKSLYGRCLQPAGQRPLPQKRPGPLRLGVVVTAGHEGIFLKLALQMLLQLPPQRCRVLLLGQAPALARTGLEYLPLAPGVSAAARQLRGLDLDLIYYWEVGSDKLNFLLPYFRPAPVQFTSWGTPATTGQPGIDYYLSSQQLDAGAQAQYSEKLLLMDALPVGSEDPLPAAGGQTRQQLGLPEGTLYVCLQNLLKFTPEFLELLARLLAADSQGQLLLTRTRSEWVNQALAPALALLEPFAERVHWRSAPIPRSEYLDLMALADVCLDTLVCSGGQTSHEALCLGLPVVTLPGTAQHSRLTLARYRQLGLETGLACDSDDYLRLALEFGRQGQALRQELLARRDRLLEHREAGEQFSELIWQMAVNEGLREPAS